MTMDDPGEEPSKRRKIDIACQRCRKKRTKCDGGRPSCGTCSKSESQCFYIDTTKKEFIFKAVHVGSQPRKQSTETLPEVVVEGDTGQHGNVEPAITQTSIRIPFFRYFGPTGISPGYKAMLFDVKQADNSSNLAQPMRRKDSVTPKTAASAVDQSLDDLFEPDGLLPRLEIRMSLINTFFSRFHCHFPFYSRTSFMATVEDRTASALLLNSMCALAARFSDLPQLQREVTYLRGEVFANKAKYMLVPLFNLPSPEVVASTLMIAWHELANNHDVGLWIYTGVCCRLAVDLGLETAINTTAGQNSRHSLNVNKLFWAVDFLDHIICFATGRPLTIRREQISAPLPETSGEIFDGINARPHPFASAVVIIQYLGKVNEDQELFKHHSNELSVISINRFMQYSDELISYYTSIDPHLTFTIQNFKEYATENQGGAFLLLHIWFNAIIILLHRPGLRFGQNRDRDNVFLCPDSRQLSISSARTISSIISMSDLISPASITSSPFLDQAIEMAGLVFSAEINNSIDLAIYATVPHAIQLEQLTHHSNYQICLQSLESIMKYWKGIGWVLTTLQQRYNGATETDPAEGSVDPKAVITLSDPRIISRLLERVMTNTDSAWTLPNEIGQAPGRQDSRMRLDYTSAIGIGVTGNTDPASKESVTIFQPAFDDISHNTQVGEWQQENHHFNFETFETGLRSQPDMPSSNWWLDSQMLQELGHDLLDQGQG